MNLLHVLQHVKSCTDASWILMGLMMSESIHSDLQQTCFIIWVEVILLGQLWWQDNVVIEVFHCFLGDRSADLRHFSV